MGIITYIYIPSTNSSYKIFCMSAGRSCSLIIYKQVTQNLYVDWLIYNLDSGNWLEPFFLARVEDNIHTHVQHSIHTITSTTQHTHINITQHTHYKYNTTYT